MKTKLGGTAGIILSSLCYKDESFLLFKNINSNHNNYRKYKSEE